MLSWARHSATWRKGRPINSAFERVRVLSGLESVDYITIFEEDTPERIVSVLRPHILVKGSDWEKEAVVGKKYVEAYGGEVAMIPYIEDCSTTGIIEKIMSKYGG